MTQVRSARRIPTAVPIAVGLAWAAVLLSELTGAASRVHHDHLAHSGLPLWAATALFLISWQVMVVAMMLPSTVPLVRLFSIASANAPRPGRQIAALLGGYAAVWSAFGVVAFWSDLAFHSFVDHNPWLESRTYLISGSVLLLAGAFQFSRLKEACLQKCRNPGAYLLPRYRRGAVAAFRLGRGHGLFCLGCCWALMLLMFSVGLTSLWWMATLAALMYYEKVGRYGRQAADVAGVALLAAGGMVLLIPPLT
ncbi:MAG TPA: DUF2182 domain-containing protein [Sporichthyaceae bacterium]|nr:DUF2182 domain-containing protein [Sporichthyaceae bacterium]